jgi:hypothetical protein
LTSAKSGHSCVSAGHSNTFQYELPSESGSLAAWLDEVEKDCAVKDEAASGKAIDKITLFSFKIYASWFDLNNVL